MSYKYLIDAVDKNKTPQSEPLPGTAQVENNAGGFSWQVDKWKRLERFLILGSEGGTYYVGERDLTKQNISCIEECLKENGKRVVKTIYEISDAGRAPKNEPALFALAVAISKGDLETKQYADSMFTTIVRTGTHLFHFVAYVDKLRGWGPILRRSIREWYLSKNLKQLSYQLVKYQNRDGWGHRDLLRLSHPRPLNDAYSQAFKWSVGKDIEGYAHHKDLELIYVFESAKTANEEQTITLIDKYNLPREAVKTEYLKSPKVWEALLKNMPITAMIRNLGNMSSVGLLTPNSNAMIKVINTITNPEILRKGRVHPLNLFLASKTYGKGRGIKGSNTWSPEVCLYDALNEAFYLSFKQLQPTNKRFFLGLDVSGSMVGSRISGYDLDAREASALMAMVTLRTEKFYFTGCFSLGDGQGIYRQNGFAKLLLDPKGTLDQTTSIMDSIAFGGTDCALPMLYAAKQKIPADIFVIYTDSETWAGDIHPSVALEKYRQKMGIPAKLVVVGMTSNGFTIADPNDSGQMDVVGFDTTVPTIISDFVTDGQINTKEIDEN